MEKIISFYNNHLPLLIDWGWRLLIAIAIAVIGYWITRRIANYCQRAFEKRGQMDKATASFVGSIISISLYILVLATALQQLGIPMASLLAVLGAMALGIGLALKDTFSNIAAGIVLLFTHPYRAGDYVVINGVEGIIEKIGLLQTVMRSSTNQEITVPNGSIVTSNIINYSIRSTRRLDYTFSIAYEADFQQARDIIKKVIAADTRFHQEPKPNIWMNELAASSVNIAVKVWTDNADFWDVRSDFIESVKAKFDGADISIPVPLQVNVPKEKEARS
ncbi:MAG: mechanosensitive ion channel domain-containing protein [Abditibacteriaceae bacterium]